MAEFWHYFALTLPVALALWAFVEWRQRHKRGPAARHEPTFDEPTWAGFDPGAPTGCPHPHFKRVYVLRDGVSTPTDEMQCVQCKQRMRA